LLVMSMVSTLVLVVLFCVVGVIGVVIIVYVHDMYVYDVVVGYGANCVVIYGMFGGLRVFAVYGVVVFAYVVYFIYMCVFELAVVVMLSRVCGLCSTLSINKRTTEPPTIATSITTRTTTTSCNTMLA